MNWVVAYLAAAAAFLAIDYVWLAKVAKSFYRDRLGGFLRDKPNLPAAVLFYLVYVVGIIVFAVAPALQKKAGRPPYYSEGCLDFSPTQLMT